MRIASYYDSTLSALAESNFSPSRNKNIFRGCRGVALSDVTKLLDQSKLASLPKDMRELDVLFSQAFEDGLIAIGLLSVAAIEQPGLALEMAERWSLIIDDALSADSLGSLVIGPCLLRLGSRFEPRWEDIDKPFARRAELMALTSGVAESPKGPCAAALRAHFHSKDIIFSDTLDPSVVMALRHALEQQVWLPIEKKALIRVLTIVSSHAPDDMLLAIKNGPKNTPIWMRKAIEKGVRSHRKRFPAPS